jgi:membrane-associated phospholipid phosphatase
VPWRLTDGVGQAPSRNRRFLIAALLAGLVAFALLAAGYERNPLAALDREVAEWVARGMPTWVEWLGRPFSWVGGWIGLGPISVGLVVLLLLTLRVFDAVWVALTLSGIHIVTPLVKEAFDRPRPDQGSAVPLPSSDSFPSGHASGAVVTFGVLAALGAERWPERARLLWSAAVALVVAVGASRTVLNVHYVTDVLAGWYLGLVWLAGCLLVREVAARRHGDLVAQSH